MQTSSSRPKQHKTLSWSARAVPWLCGALVLLYLYHFFTIWTYAVNVPFWDEWVVFNDDALSRHFDGSWLWAQLNEHRMVTNKLVIWSLYRLNGWDIGLQQSLNFLLFGGMVWLAIAVSRRIAPRMPLAVLLAFAVFLLSPLNHENLFMTV